MVVRQFSVVVCRSFYVKKDCLLDSTFLVKILFSFGVPYIDLLPDEPKKLKRMDLEDFCKLGGRGICLTL